MEKTFHREKQVRGTLVARIDFPLSELMVEIERFAVKAD